MDIKRFNVVLENFCFAVVQGGGGGGDRTPPVGFLICCNISKRFCLQWKAFNLLYKMRPPSCILSRIRNQVKTVRINIFWRLTLKITLTILITLHHFLLLLNKVDKTMRVFSQKWLDHLLLMTSYLLTTVNTVNLSQDTREG